MIDSDAWQAFCYSHCVKPLRFSLETILYANQHLLMTPKIWPKKAYEDPPV